MTNDNNSNAIIGADTDNLRMVSQQLRTALETLENQRKLLVEVRAAARAEAALGTKTHTPAPIYSPILSALDTAVDKIDTAINQFHANVSGDATALTTIADQLDQSTTSAAQQAARVAGGNT
jgi:hypothetical protein